MSEQGQWVPTLCYMCYSRCSIKARRVDGLVVDVVGNPKDPNTAGRICAKGKAGIISVHDPYRVKSPLKRTNRDKGMGIDPGWKEISWEEALTTIAERLKEIRRDDPRKLVLGGMDFLLFAYCNFFASAFGTPNIWKGGADYFCGNALHPVTYLTNGAFYGEVDLDYCNYCLLIGTQYGFMVRTTAVSNSKRMADARARGMKVVVVDPVRGNAGSKADEWVSIRPGTDGALALGMLNLLLNELGIYDAEFIKRHTNGPYLITPAGDYLREAGTGKPLLWDAQDGKAKAYDAEVKEPAIEGRYLVEGLECQPAFQRLKEHVEDYPPDRVSKVTTVPEETVRRLATEFGEAAKVGSKIVIEGKELPFRPAVALWTRGAITHKHAMMTGLAIQLLNIVVGAIDVPGGMLGSRTKGPFWGPSEGADGLIMPDPLQLVEEAAFPARKARLPENVEMRELLPVSPYAAPFFEEAILNPEKYKFPYRPEAMIICMSNVMMSTSSPQRISEVLKRIPFIVSLTTHLDETAEFADIVLPETHYLERRGVIPNFMMIGVPQGMGDWFWSVGQPVVPPSSLARCWVDVLFELADRAGFAGDLYAILNNGMGLKEPYRLKMDGKYSLDEIEDMWAKSWFGPERDLNWFKENGIITLGRKKVEETYPRPFLKARVPIYYEHLKKAGEDLKMVTEQMGLNWDTWDYQSLPAWGPCPGHEERPNQYDLYPVNFKLPFHTFTFTTQNPWLSELGEHHPYAYKILINSSTATQKGIENGDLIWVESAAGRVKGEAMVTETVHPQAVGIAGIFGHWAAGMPLAKGKGVHFNALLSSTPEYLDLVCAALDTCAKVRVYKA